MHTNETHDRCALCGGELPRGVRVALFSSPESEEPLLGYFCSVAHAYSALDDVASLGVVPDTLFLGVRIDRDGHDEGALASVMAEIARRAVRAALADEEAPESVPPSAPRDRATLN